MPESSALEQILKVRRDASADIVNPDEQTVKLVIFALGDEWFAFPGDAIREILPPVNIFFVPGCPASMEGVINVRGDIESVINLAELLGKPVVPSAPGSSILRGTGGGMQSGIRVERVIDVLDLAQSAIQPPPAALPERMRRLVSGLTRHQDVPVTILDLNHLFEDYQRG